jgi:hypothetical protein
MPVAPTKHAQLVSPKLDAKLKAADDAFDAGARRAPVLGWRPHSPRRQDRRDGLAPDPERLAQLDLTILDD